MPVKVKWLIVLLCFSPVVLLANQENDMELFEFLAVYEQSDNVFIDAEMDNKNEQDLTNQNIVKSESDE